MSFACYSAAASLILGAAGAAAGDSSCGVELSSAAGASSGVGSAFFAGFFLGGAFLPLAVAFPLAAGFLAAGLGLAFSIYAFLTSSTDLPDLSSSITSYNIDSCTPSVIVVYPP